MPASQQSAPFTPTPSPGVRRYYGKYRGSVVNNVDPYRQGRIQVKVPAVLGDSQMSWAMPCAPFAGSQVGFFAIPPTGANVWVEFEGGNPNHPVWVGGFWDKGSAPAQPALAEMHVLKTKNGTITVSDLPGVGGITLETTDGSKISITPTGIEITNGKGATISMQGPKVSINNGALDVI